MTAMALPCTLYRHLVFITDDGSSRCARRDAHDMPAGRLSLFTKIKSHSPTGRLITTAATFKNAAERKIDKRFDVKRARARTERL